MKDDLIDRGIRIVGQNPWDVERFDDKEWTNRWLEGHQELREAFPKSVLVERSRKESDGRGFEDVLGGLAMPVIVKPIRGRGSSGVSKVETEQELRKAMDELFKDSDAVMIEVSWFDVSTDQLPVCYLH